jgi:hypothetical protein
LGEIQNKLCWGTGDRYFFDLITVFWLLWRFKDNLELCIWHNTVQNSQMVVGILAVSKMGDCVGFAVF